MRTFLVACATALGLTGCAMTMPMATYDNIQIAQHDRSAEEIGPAIERALVSRNWVVTARRPGEIDASLIGPEFRASISVPYNTHSYSLRYRDSQGLDYNGNIIHRHYHNWMTNLQVSIERELISAPPLVAPAAAPAPQPAPEQPGAQQ